MYDKRCGGRGRGSGSRKGAIRLVRGSVGEARETERSHKKKRDEEAAGGRRERVRTKRPEGGVEGWWLWKGGVGRGSLDVCELSRDVGSAAGPN